MSSTPEDDNFVAKTSVEYDKYWFSVRAQNVRFNEIIRPRSIKSNENNQK